MMQKALDVGILVTWTKSFNSPGVVGQDAVKMLKEAIKRRGVSNTWVVCVWRDRGRGFLHLHYPLLFNSFILSATNNARLLNYEYHNNDDVEVLSD